MHSVAVVEKLMGGKESSNCGTVKYRCPIVGKPRFETCFFLSNISSKDSQYENGLENNHNVILVFYHCVWIIKAVRDIQIISILFDRFNRYGMWGTQ